MRRFLLAAIFYLSFHSGYAQFDSAATGNYLLNFAVPDMPAFKALGTEPNDILRPSDIKSLALVFSKFQDNGTLVIPKSFAAEIAPGMLISGNTTISDYQNSPMLRFWMKSRISIGTVRDDIKDNPSKMAGGVRFTFIDKGDFRNDIAFLNKYVYKPLNDLETISSKADKEYVRQTGTIEVDTSSKKYKTIRDSIAKKSWAEQVEQSNKSIDVAIDKYKKTHWNAMRLEFAYAIVGTSPDTLAKNISASKHSVWLIGAFPLSCKCGSQKKPWGQWLIGANYHLTENDSTSSFNSNLIASTRLYAGGNRLKAYIEGQYKYNDLTNANNLTASIGGEINIRDGIWLNFSAGVENALASDASSQFVSSFNLFLTLPENFNLF